MKKIFTLGIAWVIGLALCNPVTAKEISIVGTGSGMKVLEAIADAFMQEHPDININIPGSIGSGGGVKAVGSNKYEIGRVARKIKSNEEHYNLSHVPIARMAIIFFANKSTGIHTLAPKQLCDIYRGEINNWKEVGGKDLKVKVVRREDGDSSLRVLLKSFPGFADITITSRSKTTFSDPKTCSVIENLRGSIAFGTYINAKNYDVNILSTSDKSPTESDYPYTGFIALIFKEENRRGINKKFIEYATSPAVYDVIRNAGGIPIKSTDKSL